MGLRDDNWRTFGRPTFKRVYGLGLMIANQMEARWDM